PQMKKALESSVLRAGISAIIVIFGLAWMADTFISAHKAAWIASMGQYLQNYPILFAVICFFASSFLASQAATVRAIMPIGIALGLTPATLVGLYPSVNGTSFFPASGPVISTMQFDQSGTIKIGNYVLNHSFMVPMLVATTSATLIAFAFSRIVL
ncbi:anaerobic C4-dicarboxylate transporter family protein, partial [Turicimonas muris]